MTALLRLPAYPEFRRMPLNNEVRPIFVGTRLLREHHAWFVEPPSALHGMIRVYLGAHIDFRSLQPLRWGRNRSWDEVNHEDQRTAEATWSTLAIAVPSCALRLVEQLSFLKVARGLFACYKMCI